MAIPTRRKIQGETIFEVPALALNETQVRSFKRVAPNLADPFRNRLKGYNRSAATVEVLLDNGERFFIGPDNFVEIEGREIRWYQVTADAATNDDEIEFFEDDVEEDETEEDSI